MKDICFDDDLNQVVLIITGCISPNLHQQFLVLKDENERLKQYISSILFYIEESPLKKIVFCENSNYKYSGIGELEKIAENSGKQFEWLSFQGDFERVKTDGKGYGEGEIIEYALNNSKMMQQCISFAKVTGRLKIRNINDFFVKIKTNRNYFNRDIYGGRGVDTRFYICNKDFFNTHLLTAYRELIVDGRMFSIENVYYKILKKIGCFSSLRSYPDFQGVSGGNGINYSEMSIPLRRFYSVLCRIGLFNSVYTLIFAYKRIKLLVLKTEKNNGK